MRSMMGERTVAQEALFYGFSLERHVTVRALDRFVLMRGRRGCCGSASCRKACPFPGIVHTLVPMFFAIIGVIPRGRALKSIDTSMDAGR